MRVYFIIFCVNLAARLICPFEDIYFRNYDIYDVLPFDKSLIQSLQIRINVI
jgi:hypothetical protein